MASDANTYVAQIVPFPIRADFDPEQDLHWTTVEYLSARFKYIDLIINLPVNSLMRAIPGAYRAGGRGPGAASRFLNHSAPHELLQPNADQPSTPATIEAIRRHYDEQLMALGFKKRARRTINFPADNPVSPLRVRSVS